MKRNKNEVLELLAKGYTAAEIGKKLRLSPRTVEVYIAGLKQVYDAKNVAHLTALFVEEKYTKGGVENKKPQP